MVGGLRFRACLLGALLPLTACAHQGVSTMGPAAAKIRYVAMGSSYAAGPKLGNPKPNTPARCGRDMGNYATLVAQRLGFELIDVTCGGATTAHILGPWDELPAQLKAVTADTRLVTITIGGNDVGFVRDLYVATCDPAKSGRACPAIEIPDEAAWKALETHLAAIAARVRSQAPKAKLLFVDYVAIVPDKACAAVPLSRENIVLMRGLASRLAEVTEKVARDSGADRVSAGALSGSHTPCDAEPWSVGAPGTAEGAPWHPNGMGMQAIADVLTAKLRTWHPR